MSRVLNLFNQSQVSDYDVLDTVTLYYDRSSILEGEIGDKLIIETFSHGGTEISLSPIDSYRRVRSIPSLPDKKKLKWEIKRTLYDLLSDFFQAKRPWGVLTGIRPSKIVHDLIETGWTNLSIQARLENYYKVSEEKAKLLIKVALAERKILEANSKEDVSLYIGIPFCPTVCHYCSFSSWPIGSKQAKPDQYLDALEHEIKELAKLIDELGQRIKTIYVGGGTPTSLNSIQLSRLMRVIHGRLNTSWLKELTIEGGRPDSIDGPKLKILKDFGVSRISINPQTTNDATLQRIGRNHTTQQFLECWELARQLGFNNINLDIIGGLPGEREEDFLKTLEEITPLKPESMTFHALAIKRSSKINEFKEGYNLPEDEVSVTMASDAQIWAEKNGLEPYYLYRQKNIAGHQENIGFCIQGKECIYNVQIMEERQSIYGVGAGSVTKIYFPEDNRVERAFNIKTPNEYISRIDEMINRKKLIAITKRIC